MNHSDPVRIFKSLSDETRLRILWLLDQRELSVNDIVEVLGSTQSRVSRHLTVLKESNFLDSRREGTWVYYRKPGKDTMTPEIESAWNLICEWGRARPEVKDDRRRLKEVLQAKRSRSQQFFGKHARNWDQIRKRLCGQLVTLQALETLIPPSLTVADVGTGTGQFLIPLARMVKRVIGVDHSPEMLDVAEQNVTSAGLTNVEFRLGEIDNLPFDDCEVDAVIAGLVLHHAPDPARAIAEMARITKPGGIVTVIDLQRHTQEWMREDLADEWLGFEEESMIEWFEQSGLNETQWMEGYPPESPEGQRENQVKSFIFRGRKKTNSNQKLIETIY